MIEASTSSSSPESVSQGLITEGLASIGGGILSANNVFYNPVQVFNRDLSLIAIRAFHQMYEMEAHERALKLENSAKTKELGQSSNASKLRILEPLAASGLRSIRYAQELSEILDTVVAGDVSVEAVKTICNNRELNSISPEIMQVVWCDANQLMYCSRFGGLVGALSYAPKWGCAEGADEDMVTLKLSRVFKSVTHRFNIIDLDPYGSVAEFLDAAVQAVEEGGLLCLTSTDMPVLCGNNPEVSFYKYGGTAIKARYMHEMALRLLLHAVATTAAKYKRVIQPLLSCSIDFYVRCFVRIYSSPLKCKMLASKTALVLQCTSCDRFDLIPMGNVNASKNHLKYKAPSVPSEAAMTQCNQCDGKKAWIGGPFYSGQLYERVFKKLCLDLVTTVDEKAYWLKGLTTLPRLKGLFTAINEELDYPLFYSLPSLFNCIKSEAMKLVQFKSALLHLGYEVSHFHREPQSLKTNAPNYVIFDILRKWARIHAPKAPEKIPILQKPNTVDFDQIQIDLIHPNALSKSLDVVKWLPNPAPFWGPKARARPGGLKKSLNKKPRVMPEIESLT